MAASGSWEREGEVAPEQWEASRELEQKSPDLILLALWPG
jgi:hypothetical protein